MIWTTIQVVEGSEADFAVIGATVAQVSATVLLRQAMGIRYATCFARVMRMSTAEDRVV